METHLSWVEDYFEGRLSAEEQNSFNQQIQTDSNFAREVSFYLQSKQLGQLNRKNDLLAHHASMKNQPWAGRTKSIVWGGAFAAAASIVIGFFMFFNNSFEPQEYAQNYIKNNLTVLPSEMSDTQTLISEGSELYEAGNFEAASKVFQKDTTNLLLLEYRGVCHLRLQQYAEAIAIFEKLAAHHELLQNKGLFYQAITHLKQGHTDRAKPILTQIVSSKDDVFGKKEAKEVLEKLSN
jgi:tetratricopeptide (TPR) repeat protein